MKNQIKKTTVKELAGHFNEELNTSLPVTKLPNGSYVLKEFLVKQLPNRNWGLFDIYSKDKLNEYFLISSALIAANEYSIHRFDRYINIKHIDVRYQSAHNDVIIFNHNINNVSDNDQKEIYQTRLQESKSSALYYRKMILQLFRNAFV